MVGDSLKILCIGRDAVLLESRCAVLAHGGYEARAATIAEFQQQLGFGKFALIIISARQAAQESLAFVQGLPADTRTLILDGYISPNDLLSAVANRLQNKVITEPRHLARF
jgi:hypothetical protein